MGRVYAVVGTITAPCLAHNAGANQPLERALDQKQALSCHGRKFSLIEVPRGVKEEQPQQRHHCSAGKQMADPCERARALDIASPSRGLTSGAGFLTSRFGPLTRFHGR